MTTFKKMYYNPTTIYYKCIWNNILVKEVETHKHLGIIFSEDGW